MNNSTKKAAKPKATVKNGKMYYLSQEHFLLSPGIHYPDAVEEMAKLIYPDLFR